MAKKSKKSIKIIYDKNIKDRFIININLINGIIKMALMITKKFEEKDYNYLKKFLDYFLKENKGRYVSITIDGGNNIEDEIISFLMYYNDHFIYNFNIEDYIDVKIRISK